MHWVDPFFFAFKTIAFFEVAHTQSLQGIGAPPTDCHNMLIMINATTEPSHATSTRGHGPANSTASLAT